MNQVQNIKMTPEFNELRWKPRVIRGKLLIQTCYHLLYDDFVECSMIFCTLCSHIIVFGFVVQCKILESSNILHERFVSCKKTHLQFVNISSRVRIIHFMMHTFCLPFQNTYHLPQPAKYVTRLLKKNAL